MRKLQKVRAMWPQGRGLLRQEEVQEKAAAVGTCDNDGEGVAWWGCGSEHQQMTSA